MRQIHLVRSIFALLGIVLLAGCETPPPPPIHAPISFTDQGKIRFAVGAVQVISDYVSTGKAPNVEHEFPFSPEQTLWQWAEDRLQAAGDWGRVEMTIREASIRRDPLPTEEGVMGLFKREQNERYTATLYVTLTVENGERTGNATIRVTRSHTFLEGLSLNQRDAARHAFLESIMQDFNTEAERAIARDLGGFLAGDNA
jgi:hypothetical protein